LLDEIFVLLFIVLLCFVFIYSINQCREEVGKESASGTNERRDNGTCAGICWCWRVGYIANAGSTGKWMSKSDNLWLDEHDDG
jgi:hypothetical protein